MTVEQLNLQAIEAIKTGRAPHARRMLEEAVGRAPRFVEAWVNLGIALEDCGADVQAERSYREACRLSPSHVEALSNLGNLLRRQGKVDEAAEAFEQVLSRCADDAYALAGLGKVRLEQGRAEEAAECYRRSAALSGSHEAASDALYSALHTDHEAQKLLDEHREWARRFAPQARPARPAQYLPYDGKRPIRVGYVSPNFREHTVARFLEPVLENHSPAVRCVLYSDTSRVDDTSRRLNRYGSWRDTRGFSDAQLAGLIQADGIDVLVDLTGHMGGCRLRTFACRSAPVQMAYIGYPFTTGLDAIDYRLTDAVCDPDGAEAMGSEKLIRLEGCAWAYKPGVAPPVSPLPAMNIGYVTFGSFNRVAKITPAVAQLWGQVLLTVPGSRLLVLAPGGEGNRSVRRMLESAGIEGHRLELTPTGDREHYLGVCKRVDVALDTHPYNGMTTTCDLLWQGVPTVTRCGQTHVARVGASLLGSAGLGEWAAGSAKEYVRIAAAMAGDLPALASLRAGLRGRISASPLMDGKRLTEQIELAMENALRRFHGVPAVTAADREMAAAIAHPQGLGDQLAVLLDRTGIAPAYKLARKLVGASEECGCNGRRKALNQIGHSAKSLLGS